MCAERAFVGVVPSPGVGIQSYIRFVVFLFSSVVWTTFRELRVMNEIIHLESSNLLKERYYELKYIICVFSTLILFLPTPLALSICSFPI